MRGETSPARFKQASSSRIFSRLSLYSVSAYFKGFELVFNQFKQILDKHGVSEIKCQIGDEFDYNFHNGVVRS